MACLGFTKHIHLRNICMTAATLQDDVFYPLWAFTFRKQLKELHQGLSVADELGVPCGFEDQPFDDFCLMVYQLRPDLIDYCQN